MYANKYEREAKKELEEAKETYGGAFRDEVDDWLNSVVLEVERRESNLSVSVMDMMLEATQSKQGSWQFSWKKWLDAKLIAKFKAILFIVNNRCPPWELRAAICRFTVMSTFDCEITAYFEVNHVDRQVVFRLFDGLPGQG